MTEPFFANFDLASLSIWLFWIFFAGLVVYLQRENQREGYPLEDDRGNPAPSPGLFPLPGDKTFHLPFGRGTLTVPSEQPGERPDLALRNSAAAGGFPIEPTGDPMTDGIGPASWAARSDRPEVDAHNRPKIVPMSQHPEYEVVTRRDPRGLPVMSGDRRLVGEVTDLWVDRSESMVRYLAYDLAEGGGTRLVPNTMVRIRSDRVVIKSLYADQFPGIPATASPDQVTLLEEDRIMGYYGGGYLYAGQRQEPRLQA